MTEDCKIPSLPRKTAGQSCLRAVKGTCAFFQAVTTPSRGARSASSLHLQDGFPKHTQLHLYTDQAIWQSAPVSGNQFPLGSAMPARKHNPRTLDRAKALQGPKSW